MSALLFNAGSSSLKFSLMAEDGAVLADGSSDWAGTPPRYRFRDRAEEAVAFRSPGPAVRRAIADLRRETLLPEGLLGVGHRWVHGGDFRESVRITPEVRSRLDALSRLAPLHAPPSLEALDAAMEELPDVPHVAAFDTAFHASLAPEAYTFAVPEQWTREWGVRRYGFHGLNYDYCSSRAAEMLGGRADLRLVICHLGQGCSAAAVRGRICVDTTMGFTPLDGLVMATRSGSLDPGALLFVQQHHGLSAAEVERALNRESGLLGLSGISGDLREVRAAAAVGNERAKLALDVYIRRLRQAIGALTAMLGGIDALIFTGGVGEHAGDVRASTCADLKYLGLEIDAAANAAANADADIATANSAVRVLVIAAREDLVMLREVRRLT